jgi:hypothetical protein
VKVVIMMECSGRVRDQFLKRGHDAISVDIQDTEVPGPHSTLHWWEFLERYPQWDLMIAHPPCTYLAVSGARWFYHPDDAHLPVEVRRPHPKYPTRWEDQAEAVKVVEALALKYPDIKKRAIENPVGRLPTLSRLGPATQIVQPYWFGDPEKKATCLWLYGLQPLVADKIVKPTKTSVHHASPGPQRAVERSRTFRGFARAMAEQWG